jgi:hypothetical protein
MLDFPAERSSGTGLTFDVADHIETPLEHDDGVTTLGRVWLSFTTGAGVIATAAGISAVVSIALAWTFVTGLLYRDHADERRAILQRILDLTALQAGSQSALGCLDVSPGDALEESCERTVFANPQTVASANAFVAARLSLLGDALAFASGAHSRPAGAVVALRQAVENDPFGIVAHVLAGRYGCSPSQCSAFAMLADTTKVIANLNARTFDNLVGRYVIIWQVQAAATSALTGPGAGVTAISSLPGQGPPVVAAVPGALPHLHGVSGGVAPKGLYVPPASSIPAVSIMTEEPHTPPAQTGTPSTASGAIQHAPASPHSNPHPAPSTPVTPPIQLSPNLANPANPS